MSDPLLIIWFCQANTAHSNHKAHLKMIFDKNFVVAGHTLVYEEWLDMAYPWSERASNYRNDIPPEECQASMIFVGSAYGGPSARMPIVKKLVSAAMEDGRIEL